MVQRSIRMKRTKQAKLLKRSNTPVNLVPEEEADTPKALLNDVVLQNIFKYLTFEDLRSSRQVGNRTWFRNIKKPWWSHVKLVCRSGENLQVELMNFLSLPEVASNATSFRFQFVHLERLDRFWMNFGHSIKHLEIFFGAVSSPDNFREIIYRRLENLEWLVCDCSTLNYSEETTAESVKRENSQHGQNANLKYLEWNGESPPVGWLELLSHFSSLEALKVRTGNIEIYNTISNIRKANPKLLDLKHIDVRHNEPADKSIRDVLLDSKLSLEKIFINRINCQPETFTSILKLHGKSLKELIVHENHIEHLGADGPLSLPEPFEKLETFEARNCVFTAGIFQYIPNVRKVTLGYSLSLQTLSPGAVSNLKINSCRELSLQIHRRHCDDHKEDLEFVMNLFPNVEKLKIIDITNSQFSRICEQWKHLTHFECDLFSQVDITGLLGYAPDSAVSNAARRPNIADLRDLRYFSMTGHNGIEMKHAQLIHKELQELQMLNKFELRRYTVDISYTDKEKQSLK